MRGVAIMLPNWIGDAVMATPAIRAARKHWPEAKLIAVGKPHILNVFDGLDWFDHRIAFEKKAFLKAVNELRRLRPDAALLFPNSLRPALLAKLAGCTQIAGFARYFRDTLLTHRLYAKRDQRGGFKPVPIIDDYNRIATVLGVPDPGHELELAAAGDDEAQADLFWNQTRFDRFPHVIGLNPGGAFGAGKHWPTEHFASVAHDLAKAGHGVVVLCGPSERDEAIRIAAAAKHPHVVSLTSLPPSIGLTKAAVRRLSLLITTDSGPRHFAQAFKVPVVSLFGPTHIEWTETYYAKAVHLQHKLDCGPCQQRVCPLGHHRCMTELTPSRVLAASKQLLKQQEMRHAG